MVISYGNDETVQLKTKTETVVLGPEVKIGSFQISGPGEYDIASIQCEGQPLKQGTAYFIRAEDLFVTYLTAVDENASKLDTASDTEILVIDLRSDDTPEKTKAIIKAIEPAYVFLTGAGSTAGIAEKLGLPLSPDNPLKITKAGLPLEGTLLVSRL